jgi:pimeloyl-ACP methyl ester carboxylesterase
MRATSMCGFPTATTAPSDTACSICMTARRCSASNGASVTTRTAFVDNVLFGRPRADQYLRFIVEELKPAIDRKFATRPGRDDTVIMGSSMGAIISLYAIAEYPQVFGAAGCLSTHWLGGFDNNARVPLATFGYWITVHSGSMPTTPYINNSSTS